MRRFAVTFAASLAFVLAAGTSSLALADLPGPGPRPTPGPEPLPEIEPEPDGGAEAGEPATPELAAPPQDKAEEKAEDKADDKGDDKKDEAKADDKKADAKKGGSCSVRPADDTVLGLAALVLLISGVSLRRRS